MIAAGLGAYSYFGETIIKQSRRMKLGREYLPAISNALQSLPEFRDVQVGVGTAKTGCFLVVGMVETHKHLATLQSIIASTKPPLEVVYRLKVLEDYAEKSSAEPGASPNAGPAMPSGNSEATGGGNR
jgi:hypothetical protein